MPVEQTSVLFKSLSDHTVLSSNLSFSTCQLCRLAQVSKIFWGSFPSFITPQ